MHEMRRNSPVKDILNDWSVDLNRTDEQRNRIIFNWKNYSSNDWLSIIEDYTRSILQPEY